MWVQNQNAGQPTASIPYRLDGDLAKVTPFAFASPLLKIDAEGPTATSGVLGMAPSPCVLKFGLKYGDFLSTCVQVSGNTTTDTDELNKLIGGLRHSPERFSFNITGVDINFTDATLANDKVVSDSDRPTPDDISTRFTVDQSALGKIANDYVGNDATKAQDLHGSGLVYLEYARLVQQELNKLTGGTRTLGDPSCLGQSIAAQHAAGCTGFEGVITSAPPALVSDVNMKKNAFGIGAKGFGIGGMKPGHHTIVFCDDPTRACATIDPKAKGDTFPVSFARVLNVLGSGLVANLPLEARTPLLLQAVLDGARQVLEGRGQRADGRGREPSKARSTTSTRRPSIPTTCSSTRSAPASSRLPSTSIAASSTATSDRSTSSSPPTSRTAS